MEYPQYPSLSYPLILPLVTSAVEEYEYAQPTKDSLFWTTETGEDFIVTEDNDYIMCENSGTYDQEFLITEKDEDFIVTEKDEDFIINENSKIWLTKK